MMHTARKEKHNAGGTFVCSSCVWHSCLLFLAVSLDKEKYGYARRVSYPHWSVFDMHNCLQIFIRQMEVVHENSKSTLLHCSRRLHSAAHIELQIQSCVAIWEQCSRLVVCRSCSNYCRSRSATSYGEEIDMGNWPSNRLGTRSIQYCPHC